MPHRRVELRTPVKTVTASGRAAKRQLYDTAKRLELQLYDTAWSIPYKTNHSQAPNAVKRIATTQPLLSAWLRHAVPTAWLGKFLFTVTPYGDCHTHRPVVSIPSSLRCHLKSYSDSCLPTGRDFDVYPVFRGARLLPRLLFYSITD